MKIRSNQIHSSVRAHKFLPILALTVLSFTVQPFFMHAQSHSKVARKVVVRLAPDYPDFFRNGHFEARVVAEATVLPNGNVSNVEIKSGNPMFAEFATKALLRWKYAPGPAQTLEQVTFNFNSASR